MLSARHLEYISHEYKKFKQLNNNNLRNTRLVTYRRLTQVTWRLWVSLKIHMGNEIWQIEHISDWNLYLWIVRINNNCCYIFLDIKLKHLLVDSATTIVVESEYRARVAIYTRPLVTKEGSLLPGGCKRHRVREEILAKHLHEKKYETAYQPTNIPLGLIN